jgi:hypothetical protein
MFTKIILVEPHKPKDKAAWRQYEVQQGEIRAHAARISHVKNRSKQQRTKQASIRPRLDKDDQGPPTSDSLMPRFISSSAHHESLRERTCPTPSTLLPQGRRDPFLSGQTAALPEAVLRSLDHAFEVVWPKNTPFFQGSALQTVMHDWRMQGIQSKLQAHAQICAAASLGLASTNDPATSRILASIRTTHQLEAFHLIRNAIDSLSGPPSSDLLSAINQVSVSGIGDVVPAFDDGFPKSPMYKAFNSELYERFSPIGNDHHYRAIAVLIRKRGGLETLPQRLAHSILL